MLALQPPALARLAQLLLPPRSRVQPRRRRRRLRRLHLDLPRRPATGSRSVAASASSAWWPLRLRRAAPTGREGCARELRLSAFDELVAQRLHLRPQRLHLRLAAGEG